MLASVRNAVRLLKQFDEANPERNLGELVRALGIGKSATYRLIRTLQAEGLLERAPGAGGYRLGMGAVSLGAVSLGQFEGALGPLDRCAELCAATGETVCLGALDGAEVVVVARWDGRYAMRAHYPLGARLPAHSTGVGKVLLAHQPPAVTDRLLHRGLARLTARTIVDPDVLRDHLKEVQARGYAIDDEESEPALRSVAAPIADTGGLVRAAVAVSGPAQRLHAERVRSLIPLVLAAAAKVANRPCSGQANMVSYPHGHKNRKSV